MSNTDTQLSFALDFEEAPKPMETPKATRKPRKPKVRTLHDITAPEVLAALQECFDRGSKHPSAIAVNKQRTMQQAKFDAKARAENRRECKDCHAYGILGRNGICAGCEVSK